MCRFTRALLDGFVPAMQVNGTFLKHVYASLIAISISCSSKKFKLYFEFHWSYIFFKMKKGVIIRKRVELLRRKKAIIHVTKKKKWFYEKCTSTRLDFKMADVRQPPFGNHDVISHSRTSSLLVVELKGNTSGCTTVSHSHSIYSREV